MAHLAPGPRFLLAIEMQLRFSGSEDVLPLRLTVLPDGAEEVHHHNRRQETSLAERQTAKRPHLLLELRRRARVDRIVAAVVRPRCDLVDEQRAVVGHEELDREHAAITEL